MDTSREIGSGVSYAKREFKHSVLINLLSEENKRNDNHVHVYRRLVRHRTQTLINVLNK